MTRYALFSVNDTTDVPQFARILAALGWTILATEAPLRLLAEEGIPAVDLHEFTGVPREYPFPPTLHPRVEYCLTFPEAAERIELVYDLTYGLDQGNDVGGHALLALAAKGGRLAAATREDMRRIVAALAAGGVDDALRAELSRATFHACAAHYAKLLRQDGREALGALAYRSVRPLLWGENPYQAPAELLLTHPDPLGLPSFRQVGGPDPCFTNLADLDCLVETLVKLSLALGRRDGRAPYLAVAAKHGNPCGVGIDWRSPEACLRKALWGNPLAVWGGELVASFPLDAASAALLMTSDKRQEKLGDGKWMLDLIAAPAMDEAGLDVLRGRKSAKLFMNPALARPTPPARPEHLRMVRGGALRQPAPAYVLDLEQTPGGAGLLAAGHGDSLAAAWAACFTSNHGGNEVALARDGALLGVGGGPSTVEAAETAVLRATRHHGSLRGAVFAADAFFPFTDAPAILADAGCVAGIVPAGGRRFAEVQAFLVERGVDMAYLPEDIRGFCRH